MYTAAQTDERVKRGLRVGICGGGPGGLAMALALHRIGATVVVFEGRAADALAEEGAFLTLAPNGMNALATLGLGAAVEAVGVRMAGLSMFNEAGALLARVDYGSHRERYGAPSVTIRRGQLSSVLLQACRASGIELQLGVRVIDADCDRTSARIITTTGEERFDAVIACDGLRSTIRRRAFEDLPPPSYSGLIGTGGFVDVPEVPATRNEMHMIFGRRAFFGYLKEPGQPVYWFNSYPAGEGAAGPVSDPQEYARFIAGLHQEDPPHARLIASRIDRIDRHYPIYDMPELPRWSSGRVLLAGDAAHAVAPHSGQGASMAVEDALVLAACLADGSEIEKSFVRFQRLRRGRTRRAMILGRLSGAPKRAQGWLARRLRDLALPLFIPMGARKQEELFGFRPEPLPVGGTETAVGQVGAVM